jgi:hypothetical protein
MREELAAGAAPRTGDGDARGLSEPSRDQVNSALLPAARCVPKATLNLFENRDNDLDTGLARNACAAIRPR